MYRISSSDIFTVGELSTQQRQQLGAQLLALFSQRFLVLDSKTVLQQVIFRNENAKLQVYYNYQGVILGFFCFSVDLFTVHNNTHGVFDAGIYLKPKVSGFNKAFLKFFLGEIIRFKVHHPGIETSFIVEITHPVGYAKAASALSGAYPRMGAEPSAKIIALVNKVIRHRGFSPVDESDPWRVKLDVLVRFVDEARIMRFVQGSKNPHVQYYLERNSDFLHGQWLVLYAPLTWWNLVQNLVQGVLNRKTAAS